MKRFSFRFESIKRMRELARDEALKRVAEAQDAYDLLQKQLDELQETRAKLQVQKRGRLTGPVVVGHLLDHGRYDLQIEVNRRTLAGQMEQIALEIDRRRQRLSLAEQEYRKFEKLKEMAVEEYVANDLRLRQAEMDEIASQRRTKDFGD
jgi:flagellar export protein FliJ